MNNRFFVVPGSAGHIVPYDAESLRSNTYIRDVYGAVAERHGGRLLPLDLARGDPVLFSGTMIHGPIQGERGRLPRLVAHYLPEEATYRAHRPDTPVTVLHPHMPLAVGGGSATVDAALGPTPCCTHRSARRGGGG